MSARRFGAAVAAALLFFACNKGAGPAQEAYSQEDTLVEVARDVEILYSDSALVRVRITAPEMMYFTDREDPRQEFRQGVKVEFLTGEKTVESTLTARQGIRYDEKGQVYVRDSVELHTVRGEKLETEELIWDEKTEKVFTEKFVKVTKPGEVIYGYGLEANQDFSYWKITVPKGRIKVDPLNEALD